MTSLESPLESPLDPMLREFRIEAATTKRVLDRVPEDKLAWKPHPRSMSLGQLALHIAANPSAIIRITSADTFDVSKANFTPPNPSSVAEIQAAFEASVQAAEQAFQQTSEEAANAHWHLMAGDKELSSMPRIGAWRSILLNHWYHHRGQLSVYLRLLDVPLPSIYGPSADEGPSF